MRYEKISAQGSVLPFASEIFFFAVGQADGVRSLMLAVFVLFRSKFALLLCLNVLKCRE